MTPYQNRANPECIYKLPFFKLIARTQGSISSIFYEQLLHAQIPKSAKRQSTQAAFCAFGICERKS